MTDDAGIAVMITVNGGKRALEIEPWRNLADVLRREFRLTGTKVGCDEGTCGTCTVLLDGAPVRSCLLLAVQADGQLVETVESLAGADGTLGPLQRAFAERHALQCGFCTPGFLMLGTALLRAISRPSREQVRECVSANLCRCTGYTNIIDAIGLAAARDAE